MNGIPQSVAVSAITKQVKDALAKESLETENAKLKALLIECFEEAIGALGAGETVTPDLSHEDLANRVFQVIKL